MWATITADAWLGAGVVVAVGIMTVAAGAMRGWAKSVEAKIDTESAKRESANALVGASVARLADQIGLVRERMAALETIVGAPVWAQGPISARWGGRRSDDPGGGPWGPSEPGSGG